LADQSLVKIQLQHLAWIRLEVDLHQIDPVSLHQR